METTPSRGTKASPADDEKEKARPRRLPYWMMVSPTDSKVSADSDNKKEEKANNEKQEEQQREKGREPLSAREKRCSNPGTRRRAPVIGSTKRFHYVMSPRELEIAAKNLLLQEEERKKD